MKVDAVITSDLDKAGAEARELEEMGYDGLKSIETAHDPFLPLLLAAQSTTNIDLTTGIAVAFARSPMTLANVGHDLNAASKGRFNLGLGSQIKPHITKRFSMEWSNPGSRMREYVQALHAIWDYWQAADFSTRLSFEGDFYKHTLMTPMFSPEPLQTDKPKVFLAAVGPYRTGVAGEVCDGCGSGLGVELPRPPITSPARTANAAGERSADRGKNVEEPHVET